MGNAITQNGLVAVVCDGMGGHVGGATASRIAVDTILAHLDSVYYDDPRIAIGEAIDAANRAILQQAEITPDLSGMGSTCVLLIVREGKVYIGHVGDSRIYLVRSKKIAQLTKDHSFVQLLVDRREITKEQAEHHPRKNEITNALGMNDMEPATVADDAFVPEAGDCFVLCSDGLSGMVSDDVINKVVSKQTEMTAQERADRLVELANANGGIDNITVELVEFSVTPGTVNPSPRVPMWVKVGIPILCVLLGLGGFFLARHFKQDKSEADGQQVVTTVEQSVRETTLPVTVPFKKNGQMVELVYGENSLEFKCDNAVVYTESNVAFDASTLKVDSPDIKVQYNNSLLSFTDKNPGKKVTLSIATADKAMLYKFIINLKDAGLLERIQPAPAEAPKQEQAAPSQPKVDENASTPPPAEQEPAEVIPVRLSYPELTHGARVIINYAGDLFVKFGSQEHHTRIQIDGVSDKSLHYDAAKWDRNNAEKGIITFSFKGESSTEKHLFSVPCIQKPDGKKIVLSIELAPAPVPEPEPETPEPESVLQTA